MFVLYSELCVDYVEAVSALFFYIIYIQHIMKPAEKKNKINKNKKRNSIFIQFTAKLKKIFIFIYSLINC